MSNCSACGGELGNGYVCQAMDLNEDSPGLAPIKCGFSRVLIKIGLSKVFRAPFRELSRDGFKFWMCLTHLSLILCTLYIAKYYFEHTASLAQVIMGKDAQPTCCTCRSCLLQIRLFIF